MTEGAGQATTTSVERVCTIIICSLAIIERAASLERAIRSVLEGNVSTPSVLVVVNGNRFDRTLLATLRARTDIEVLQISTASLSDAIAAGRRAISTPFFGFLDDDDEYLPGAVDLRLSLLDKHPEASLVGTNGYRHLNGVDEKVMSHIDLVSSDPLTALFREPWLGSCSALYRAASMPNEMFDNIARYLEWTWLAFVISTAGKRVVTADVPTFRIFDTAGSESKSDAYMQAQIAIFERMLKLVESATIRAKLETRIRDSWHNRAVAALRGGESKEAMLCHLRCLRSRGGWRYLSFTRHLIPGWPQSL